MSVHVACAQQDPVYAQYLHNPLLVNPSYAGLSNNVNASLSYRIQWTGIEGHPETVNLNGHASVADNKVGVGAILLQDKIGNLKNTEFHALASYKLLLENHTISFGMQAGIMNSQSDPGKLNIDPSQADDPVFLQNNTITKPNVGAGVMLKADRFLFGVSAPRLLNSKARVLHPAFDNNTVTLYQRTFYFTGAYIFYMSNRIRLNPSVLLRASEGSQLSSSLNFNINIDAAYTAGIYTRNFNSYGVLIQTKFNNRYKFGYSFEVPSKNSLGAPHPAHELHLGISFALLKFHDAHQITNF